MSLYVWVEPSFSLTSWYTDFNAGLKAELYSKRIKVKCEILNSSYIVNDEKGMVLLVGETYQWISSMLQSLNQQNIQSCIVACEYPEIRGINCITTDHSRDMLRLISFMCKVNRNRIALFGFNLSSPHDRQRLDGYYQSSFIDGFMPNRNNVFLTEGRVSECAQQLIKKISNYNAIIAGNDLYAIYLSSQLQSQGIRIPEDLYIASFGNTHLSRIAMPSISSVSVNLYQAGQMGVTAYSIWYKNPQIAKYSFLIESKFFSRQSTENRLSPNNFEHQYNFDMSNVSISSYSDPSLLKLAQLENFIMKADSLDLQIFCELLSNSSFSDMTDKLYLSSGALDYRMSKLYHQFNVASKQELILLLNDYSQQICFPSAENEQSLTNWIDLIKNRAN